MAIATIIASSSDRVYGSNATYATARSTAAGNGADFLSIGQNVTASYDIFRSFLKFDTSILTASAVITQVNLRMVCISDQSTTNFDLQIVEQDWSASDPIASGNREAVYDACLAAAASVVWRNTNGMSINTQYTSPNLTTGYLNKAGNTYYGLRSSRDYGNNTPTTIEYVALATHTHATEAYRPALIVDYTVPSTGKFFLFF